MNEKIYIVVETHPDKRVIDAYVTLQEAKIRIEQLKQEYGNYKVFSAQITTLHR